MTKQNGEIGAFKKLLLKALTFLQEATIKQHNVDLYYRFVKLHFRLYFGYPLSLDAPRISQQKAADRHAKMVLKNLFPDAKNQDMVYCNAYESFLKNLAAETSLERMY